MRPVKVAIVVPTYNERGNIGALLEALLEQDAKSEHDLHIVVCDDASPDGTADVVSSARLRHPNVHLSPGQKLGLGAAYVRGMRVGMTELGADAVLQMDADLSHDPADVPRLLAALSAGVDLVIGSRYVPGGRIPAEWSAFRRANSRWGNRVARHVVGLHPVRDCTSGFRLTRTSLLRRIALDRIRVQGYAFLVAFLFEAMLCGARIAEIPIAFADRRRGASKLGLRDIVEFVLNAGWLRFRSLPAFGRFLAIGATGLAVNLGAFALLLDAGMDKYVASPLCAALSMLSNTALHAFWPRGSGGEHAAEPPRRSGIGFASLAAVAASYATFIAASWLFPGAAPEIAQLAAVVPAAFIDYFGNAYWTVGSRRAG
jgi:dolichol-phosphate mannosyltransferase